jgi:hypothetical protein
MFIAFMSLKMPLMPVDNLQNYVIPPFASLAYSTFPILYLLARATIFSQSAAFWAVAGLAASAYLPNRFVAIATPVIASYLIEEVASFLPIWLNIRVLSRSGDVLKQGPAISFAYFVFVFLLFSFLLGLVFSHRVRRRIRSEIV